MPSASTSSPMSRVAGDRVLVVLAHAAGVGQADAAELALQAHRGGPCTVSRPDGMQIVNWITAVDPDTVPSSGRNRAAPQKLPSAARSGATPGFTDARIRAGRVAIARHRTGVSIALRPGLLSLQCATCMARNQTVYVCSSCGGEALKWQGQCPHCSEWNYARGRLTRAVRAAPAAGAPASAVAAAPVALTAAGSRERALQLGLERTGSRLRRRPRQRVGDPARRRTRHRQVDAAAAGGRRRWRRDRAVLYASGEESAQQTALRARAPRA